MAGIVAKFWVSSITRCMSSDNETFSEMLVFNAVYSGEEGSENKQWAKWTPSGELRMTIDNPGAQNIFRVNQEVFIRISEN